MKDTKKRFAFFAWLKALVMESGIIRISKRLYDGLFNGLFGSAFTNYEKTQKKFENGFFSRLVEERKASAWNESLLGRLRRRAIIGFEESRLISTAGGSIRWLLCSYLRMYGFFFVYFGLGVLLMNFIKSFAFSYSLAVGGNWYVGFILIAVGIPMLMSKKTLLQSFDESFVFSRIIYGVFGFSRTEAEKMSEATARGSGRYLWAAMTGAVVGLLTYFLSPIIICAAILAVVLCAIVLHSPEVGVLITILVAPYLSFLGNPSIFLALLIAFTFMCMALKIFLGRLVVKTEVSDLFVMILLVLYLFGGVISVGGAPSLREAAMYACILLVYFIVTMLITSREWLEKCVVAFTVSSVGTALIGIYQLAMGNLESGTVDEQMFGNIGGRVMSTFENSNMFGVFLIMSIPFALGYLFSSRSFSGKVGSLICCCAMGICLIYTWSRGAWLGFIISCFIFVLIYNHYIIPFAVPMALAGLALVWDKIGGGMIESLISRFASIITMSDSSSVYRLGIWRGSMRIIEEYWFTGIGVGNEAFRSVYIQYAESGIENAVHSHNMFLQVIIELGVVGFAVMLTALVLVIKSGLELIKNTSATKPPERTVAVASIAALIAAAFQGITDNIWYNYRIFFVFWLVVSFVSASAKIGKKNNISKSYV